MKGFRNSIITKVAKVVDTVSEKIDKVSEAAGHTRIIFKQQLTEADGKVLKDIIHYYISSKLQNYEPIENTILAIVESEITSLPHKVVNNLLDLEATKTIKPKLKLNDLDDQIEKYTKYFNDIIITELNKNNNELTSLSEQICLKIHEFAENRLKQKVSPAYHNDPLGLLCCFLIDFTYENCIDFGPGKNSNQAKTIIRKYKYVIKFLSLLTSNKAIPNQPSSIDNFLTLSQNISEYFKGILEKVEIKFLCITTKDSFDDLYSDCKKLIKTTTGMIMYLPSDIKMDSEFSIESIGRPLILSERERAWKETRIGVLMEVLLISNEMTYLYPNLCTNKGKNDTTELSSLYSNPKSVDDPIPNVFCRYEINTTIDESHIEFLKGNKEKLNKLNIANKNIANNSPHAGRYLKTLEDELLKGVGLHQDLRDEISENIVEILYHLNDLALQTMAIELYKDKFLVNVGEIGAELYARDEREKLLSNLSDTVFKLKTCVTDMEQKISAIYSKIKSESKNEPNWKITYPSYQTNIQNTQKVAHKVYKSIGEIQKYTKKVDIKTLAKKFYKDLVLVQLVFNNVSIRANYNSIKTLPNSTFGIHPSFEPSFKRITDAMSSNNDFKKMPTSENKKPDDSQPGEKDMNDKDTTGSIQKTIQLSNNAISDKIVSSICEIQKFGADGTTQKVIDFFKTYNFAENPESHNISQILINFLMLAPLYQAALSQNEYFTQMISSTMEAIRDGQIALAADFDKIYDLCKIQSTVDTAKVEIENSPKKMEAEQKIIEKRYSSWYIVWWIAACREGEQRDLWNVINKAITTLNECNVSIEKNANLLKEQLALIKRCKESLKLNDLTQDLNWSSLISIIKIVEPNNERLIKEIQAFVTSLDNAQENPENKFFQYYVIASLVDNLDDFMYYYKKSPSKLEPLYQFLFNPSKKISEAELKELHNNISTLSNRSISNEYIVKFSKIIGIYKYLTESERFEEEFKLKDKCLNILELNENYEYLFPDDLHSLLFAKIRIKTPMNNNYVNVCFNMTSTHHEVTKYCYIAATHYLKNLYRIEKIEFCIESALKQLPVPKQSYISYYSGGVINTDNCVVM